MTSQAPPSLSGFDVPQTPLGDTLRSAIPLSTPATAAPASAPGASDKLPPPPRYGEDSTDPIEKETAKKPNGAAAGPLGTGTTRVPEPDVKGAWKELLDVSRDEVKMTLTFFAAPWAAIVLSGRVLNFLWTLVWGSPFLTKPGNLLISLVGPPIVFHFLMVVIVLGAEATQ